MRKVVDNMHHFNIYIAKDLGINAAIILSNLMHWLDINEANNTNYKEGKYWSYNSIPAFAKLFPYLSERQIRYVLNKLEEDNIIETDNFNKIAYDKTKWYTITDYGYERLHSVQPHYTKCTDGLDKVYTPIPDINTDINKDTKDYVRIKKSKPHVYDETFEIFWSAYPNKANKKGSEIKFLKLSTEEHSLIMDDLAKRKNYEGWTKDDGKYVPHPLTYLNQRRWEDEYKQTKPKVEQESVLKGIMF